MIRHATEYFHHTLPSHIIQIFIHYLKPVGKYLRFFLFGLKSFDHPVQYIYIYFFSYDTLKNYKDIKKIFQKIL